MNSSRNRGKQNGLTSDESHFESMNDSLAESLSSKVGKLKTLAIDLENESHDHIPLLEDLDDGIDLSHGKLFGTIGRLKLVGRRSGFLNGGKFILLISVTTLTFFFIIYLIYLWY